jgi:hypothetical protein
MAFLESLVRRKQGHIQLLRQTTRRLNIDFIWETIELVIHSIILSPRWNFHQQIKEKTLNCSAHTLVEQTIMFYNTHANMKCEGMAKYFCT